MLNKDKSSIYFLKVDSYSIMDKIISFLSDDMNFLCLDTTNTKEVNKRTVNHKYIIDSDAIVEVINNNKRNLDHIILYIPYLYKTTFIPKMKKKLDSVNIPYSIITSNGNIDHINFLDFDSVYSVTKKELIKNDEVITYDSFTTEYIRIATINNIIDSKY